MDLRQQTSRLWQSARRHPFRVVGVCLAMLFLAMNGVAFSHARAMTHFVTGGAKTEGPERLSAIEKLAVLVRGVRLPRPHNDRDPLSVGLKHTTHRFASADGIELEAWLIPIKRAAGTVCLFHGYAGSKETLLPEAAEFHRLGYAVCLVDFRGCGGSSGHTTTVGVHEARDVAATCEFLSRHDDAPAPRILFGRSMGSVAVLRAIACHDVQPDALILECPFSSLLTTTRCRFDQMGVPSFPFAQLLVFWGGAQHDFNGFQHRPVDDATSVQCRTLIMHGDEDPTVTVAESQAICEALAGPKRFELFKETGHRPYLKHKPQQWQEAVQSFLHP